MSIFLSSFIGAGTSDPRTYTNYQEYTTPGSYTFTVPAGVTSVRAIVIGGGGSGGRCGSSYGGGGGGGGGFAMGVYSVTPGQAIPVTVGIGGPGYNTYGNGGTSSFGAFCSATGGQTPNNYSNCYSQTPGGTGTGGTLFNSSGGFGGSGNTNGFGNCCSCSNEEQGGGGGGSAGSWLGNGGNGGPSGGGVYYQSVAGGGGGIGGAGGTGNNYPTCGGADMIGAAGGGYSGSGQNGGYYPSYSNAGGGASILNARTTSVQNTGVGYAGAAVPNYGSAPPPSYVAVSGGAGSVTATSISFATPALINANEGGGSAVWYSSSGSGTGGAGGSGGGGAGGIAYASNAGNGGNGGFMGGGGGAAGYYGTAGNGGAGGGGGGSSMGYAWYIGYNGSGGPGYVSIEWA